MDVDIANIMHKKKTHKYKRSQIISFVILLVVCTLWALPLIYMFGTSFKTKEEVISNPTGLFPSSWEGFAGFDNYAGFIIREGQLDNMPKWMFNSIFSAVCGVALTLILCSTAAYAFVFCKFRGRKILFKILIFSMTIPGVIGTTAQFAIFANIGKSMDALNSYGYLYFWLIVPGCAGVYNMYLLKNFLDSIPMDIVESARTDGASNFRIFTRIIMPLAKSTLLLIGLFAFTGSWNNLLWPQLIISATGNVTGWNTVTTALAGHAANNSLGSLGVNMATAVFSLIPIMIVFAFTQNRMIEGMATTGIKQ